MGTKRCPRTDAAFNILTFQLQTSLLPFFRFDVDFISCRCVAISYALPWAGGLGRLMQTQASCQYACAQDSALL